VLQLEGISRRFGGVPAVDNLSLSVKAGTITGLIGPNGAGKTTLINQLHGTLLPDEGSVVFDGFDMTRQPSHARALRGVARSFQISSVILDFTAAQNVALAVQARQGHSFRFWAAADDDAELQASARQALALAGLEARASTLVTHLSHGERRQLEIAIALAMQPKLLLLDEPMAGMGRNESMQLIQLLRQLKGRYTIVMVEHDMDAVFSLADRVSVLVRGRIIATGRPEQIRADPAVQAAYLGHQH